MLPIMQIGELSVFMYDALNNASILVLIIGTLMRSKKKRMCLTYPSQRIVKKSLNKNKKGTEKKAMVLAVVEIILMCLVIVFFFPKAHKIFGDLVETGMNYFGTLFLFPLIFSVLSVLVKTNPLKQIDFLTVSLPIILIVVKLACFFGGCCHGIPWEYGLYNVTYEETQVPVQLIEVFWALLALVFLLKYEKKQKTGTAFPIYVIFYCSTRFFSEFLRADVDVLWGLKTYHFLCLAGLAFGVALLLIVYVFGDKITAYYDEKEQNSKA